MAFTGTDNDGLTITGELVDDVVDGSDEEYTLRGTLSSVRGEFSSGTLSGFFGFRVDYEATYY